MFLINPSSLNNPGECLLICGGCIILIFVLMYIISKKDWI